MWWKNFFEVCGKCILFCVVTISERRHVDTELLLTFTVWCFRLSFFYFSPKKTNKNGQNIWRNFSSECTSASRSFVEFHWENTTTFPFVGKELHHLALCIIAGMKATCVWCGCGIFWPFCFDGIRYSVWVYYYYERPSSTTSYCSLCNRIIENHILVLITCGCVTLLPSSLQICMACDDKTEKRKTEFRRSCCNTIFSGMGKHKNERNIPCCRCRHSSIDGISSKWMMRVHSDAPETFLLPFCVENDATQSPGCAVVHNEI